MTILTRRASGITQTGWTSPELSYDAGTATFASWASTVANATSTIYLTGYDFAGAGLPASGIDINSVTVTVKQYVSAANRMEPPTVRPYVGATAKSTTSTLTESATTTNSQTVTFTGLTLADLLDSTFQMQFVATHYNGTISGTQFLDFIDVIVDYSPTNVSGTVTLSGAGTLLSTGTPGVINTANLFGDGNLVSVFGASSAPALSGAGTLLSTPTPGIISTANLSGGGTLGSLGSGLSVNGSSTLSGSGALSQVATSGVHNTATLSGSGDLSVLSTTSASGSAELTGSGSLSQVGTVDYPAIPGLVADERLNLEEQPIYATTPPYTPRTGRIISYFKSDNNLYYKDSNGVEQPVAPSNVVLLTDDQTIAGVKTFSSGPVVPDASWTIAKTNGLQGALDLKAPLASPTFTGTVSGITNTMVGAAAAVHDHDDRYFTEAEANTNFVDNYTNETIGGEKTFTGTFLDIRKAATAGVGGVLSITNSATAAVGNAVDINMAGNPGGGPLAPTGRIRLTEGASAAATLGFWTYDGTTLAERVTISPSGNVNVTGTVTAGGAGFAGPGVNITTLNATNLTTGTVPDLRLSGSVHLDRGFVSTSTDFNAFTSQGSWKIIGASTWTNFPAGAYQWGQLVVTKGETSLTQVYYPDTTGAAAAPWIRHAYGGAPDFKAWIQLTETSSTVLTTGNQTIAGTKTFSSEIIGGNGLTGNVLRVGNDSRIVDVDTAHAMAFVSTTDATRGTIILGSSATNWRLEGSGTGGWIYGTTTLVNNATFTGGWTTLNNGTSNTIRFEQPGVSAPVMNATSSGTKIILYPAATPTDTNYAIGIEGSTLWQSIPTAAATNYFKWYGGTTLAAQLTGNGNFYTSGTITADGGTGALHLKPGSQDHVYMSFYARTASPGTRSAYFGYASGGSGNIELKNEISGGWIQINTSGNGQIDLNAGTGSVNVTGRLSARRDTSSTDYSLSAIEARNDSTGYPAISFHKAGAYAPQLRATTGNRFQFVNQAGTAVVELDAYIDGSQVNRGTVPAARQQVKKRMLFLALNSTVAVQDFIDEGWEVTTITSEPTLATARQYDMFGYDTNWGGIGSNNALIQGLWGAGVSIYTSGNDTTALSPLFTGVASDNGYDNNQYPNGSHVLATGWSVFADGDLTYYLTGVNSTAIVFMTNQIAANNWQPTGVAMENPATGARWVHIQPYSNSHSYGVRQSAAKWLMSAKGEPGTASATGGGREAVVGQANISGTYTMDLNLASVWETSQSGNVTLAMSNVPASGVSCTATISIYSATTGYTITPPANSKIMGAAIPTSTAGKHITLTLFTPNGGSWWQVSAVKEV